MNYYKPNSLVKFTATPETTKKNTTYQIFLNGSNFMTGVSWVDLIDAWFLPWNWDTEETNEGT